MRSLNVSARTLPPHTLPPLSFQPKNPPTTSRVCRVAQRFYGDMPGVIVVAWLEKVEILLARSDGTEGCEQRENAWIHSSHGWVSFENLE